VSTTTNSIIRGVFGLLYAVIYGFWTMLATGGGHGNYVWFYLFFYAYFFGVYFPLMGALSADLRSFGHRVVFGSLIAINLGISLVVILVWLFGGAGGDLDDFETTWGIGGSGLVLFSAFLHFLPSLIFLYILNRAVYFDSPSIEYSSDDDIIVAGQVSENDK
jgi:hypothetical protein